METHTLYVSAEPDVSEWLEVKTYSDFSNAFCFARLFSGHGLYTKIEDAKGQIRSKLHSTSAPTESLQADD